jgi:hypothetical protein
MAHFDIQGTTCHVVHYINGAEEREPLMTVVTRACSELGGVMDQLRAEGTGNISLSFDDSYFPRRGQIDGPGRSVLNAKKAAVQLAIYQEMLRLGIDEKAISFSEGFMGNKGWVGTKRLYFNKVTAAEAAQANTEQSTEQLVESAIAAGADIDSIDEALTKWADESKTSLLRGWLKRQITVASTATATKEATVNIADGVPEDEDEPVDTDQL